MLSSGCQDLTSRIRVFAGFCRAPTNIPFEWLAKSADCLKFSSWHCSSSRCNVAHQGAVSAVRRGGSEFTGGGVDRRQKLEAATASAARLSDAIQTKAASWWQSYG